MVHVPSERHPHHADHVPRRAELVVRTISIWRFNVLRIEDVIENEAPRSKLRGITEPKHSELPEIIVRLPLPLPIPLDGLPVRALPYRCHLVPVGPTLPTP